MKGEGTELAFSTDGSTWKTIGKAYSITGGGLTRNTVEEQPFLETPEGAYDRLDPHTLKIEPISAEVRWQPNSGDTKNHKALRALLENNTQAFFRLKYPTSDNFGEIIHGFVSRWGDSEIAPFQHIRAPFTITGSGQYYWSGTNVTAEVPAIA